jgi:hypothetical protein
VQHAVGAHAGQPEWAGAADQPQEHCLSLVVGRVAGGDAGRASPTDDVGKERVADGAGRLLEGLPVCARMRGDVAPLDYHVQAEGLPELRDAARVLRRLGSQPVVQVSEGEVEVERWRGGGQRVG